jgi:hypothetical protein
MGIARRHVGSRPAVWTAYNSFSSIDALADAVRQSQQFKTDSNGAALRRKPGAVLILTSSYNFANAAEMMV